MHRTYVEQQFRGLTSLEGAVTLQDLTLVKCSFLSCSLWSLSNPTSRVQVRNVTLTRCAIVGESSNVRGAIIEDCTVDGLKTGGLLHLDGCAFKHLVVRGTLGRVLLTNSPLASPWLSEETAQAFVDANASFYSELDWALDISEMRSSDFGMRGVPGRLIRRNPETQVLFRRERLVDSDWQRLELDRVVRFWLSYLIKNGWEDGVFVVPTRGPHRHDMMESMLTLRREGLAEPD